MKIFRNKKGFTLIELLVVLAIIGVLIGLAVGGIRIVQQVNRDTQRKAMVRDMQLALEAVNEKSNRYPALYTSGGGTGDFKLETGLSDCAGTKITAKSGTFSDDVCSKVVFTPTSAGASLTVCEANVTNGTKESNTGNLTICYNGTGKGYKIIVLLERSTPYVIEN
jgi:prepilin-type N-terminal cleavage/methylation domain-containing protein